MIFSAGEITLEDGTKLWQWVVPKGLKAGDKLEATYEERDGKKMVTSIKVEKYQ